MAKTDGNMIETTEHLVLHLEKSRGEAEVPVCAIDTEADSLHRYRESLCLVQFADRGESVLIDPLAIEDLAPLGDFLAEATVWMHGADYDMTMLKREFGRLPRHVFDILWRKKGSIWVMSSISFTVIPDFNAL